MASFTNATTHIPECFERKIQIDNEVIANYDSHVSRHGNLIYVDDWKKFKDERKELKSNQDLARYSCAESIKRANGP